MSDRRAEDAPGSGAGPALHWNAVGAVRRFLSDPGGSVPATPEETDMALGRVLLEYGWVLPAQLEEILKEVESSRVAGGGGLSAHLLKHNIVSMARLGYALRIASGEPGAADGDPSSAARIGRFPLLAELGRGGMGVVYRAVDPRIKREIALKVLPQAVGDSVALKRFTREASAIGRLLHPNVVHVYEVGHAEGRPYIAMELLEGPSLAESFREGIGLKERVRMISKVARAVAYAHRYGVVHRDLKPENIKLGAHLEPKVMDFGLASLDGGASDITRPGTIMGTPSYMAPEQVRGDWVGPPADVYALGVILYVAVTGTVPFKGKTPQEVYAGILGQEPTPVRRVKDDVPADLEAVCMKAMEKSEARRYAGAGEFADDLDRFLELRPVLARRATVVDRIWKRIRRQPVTWALAAVLTASVVSGAAIWIQRMIADRNAARMTLELERTRLFLSTLEARLDRYQEDDALEEIRASLDELEHSLRRLLANHPREVMGWVLLGDVRRMRYREDEAVQAYSEALAASDASDPREDPAVARAHFGRALARIGIAIDLQLVQRDFEDEQVNRRSQELVNLAGEDIDNIREGILPEELRDLAAAWSEHLKWQRGDPEAEGRLLGICDGRIRNGGRNHWFYFLRSLHSPPTDALRLCEAARDRCRGEVRIALRLGAIQLGLDCTEESVASYTEAIRLRPDSPDGYFNRAFGLQIAGRFDEAIADLNTAIGIAPDLPWLFLNRGATRAQMGDQEAALADFDRVTQLAPENPLGWSDRGAMLAITGRLQEARESVDRALRLDGSSPHALVQSARIWIEFNEMDLAARDSQLAVEADPESADAWALLGRTRLYQGDMNGALRALDQAVRFEPHEAETHEMRGVVLLNVGRDEEALSAFTRSIELGPNRAAPYHFRGMLRSAADPQAAFDDFTMAIERDDGWGMPYYRRGLVRRDLGDVEGAIEDYRAALQRRVLTNAPEIRAALEAAERSLTPASPEF